ncbi:vWA domain-containing protein [Streptomyces sp. NPDC002911]
MSVPLILNKQPVRRSQLATLRGLPPNFAVVYALKTGGWEIESPRHLTAAGRLQNRYKLCYVVDLGDHRRTAKLTRTPLTCKDQAHRFEATIDVGFRVHDPVAVVRSGLPDALSAVYPHLISRIRPQAAHFDIEDAFEAQTRINAALPLPLPMPEGVTLYYCDVQLEPDQAAREFIRVRKKAGRDSEVGRLKHTAAIGNTHHKEAVADIEQMARLERDKRERAALASVRLDFRSLILEHLAKHPDDTEKSMELLMRLEESRQKRAVDQEQRQVEMVRYMIDNGIVREVDLPGLRDGVLGPSVNVFSGVLPPAAGTPPPMHSLPTPAPQQLPPAPPTPAAPRTPPPWGGTRPGSAYGPGDTSPASSPEGRPAAAGLAQVYVVLDTSPAAAGCVTELRDVLGSLQAALAESPDVAAAVRLSVLTFSGTADVRMPLTQISPGTGIPDFQAGDDCRYEPVFRRLLELVPLETERLKQQASRVNRPTVFFLAVGDPVDGGAWQAARQELMQHRYRPNIVACGIGTTDRRAVAQIASLTEFALSANARTDLSESVAQFSLLLRNTVLHLGRSAVTGSSELLLERPRGLTPVDGIE